MANIRLIKEKMGKHLKIAYTYEKSGTIYFRSVPKSFFDAVEKSIEEVLEHEELHLVLDKVVDSAASEKLDNIFPHSRCIHTDCLECELRPNYLKLSWQACITYEGSQQ